PPTPSLLPYTTLFRSYGGASTYGLWTARTRARREHSLWLTGLHWATRYHFRVVSGGAKSADATFTTPALDPSRHTTSVDSAKRRSEEHTSELQSPDHL